ncbi:MAG: FtsQ-type POTRA domain-containing protein [Clostridia bacterium]|nr:FtsQ-type POTRA domain-containing protein [Clostridia bacterium]
MDKQKILFLAVTVLMCAAALISLFMVIRSFLPVTRFELYGVTQYDRSEIVGQSGIKSGDKLYSLDLDGAEQSILEGCPYISEVTFERRFPNTLIIRVTEKTAVWYLEVSGDYYSLDENFRVIEETSSNQKFINAGVSKLILPNLRSLVVGELPDFGADDTEIRKALELVTSVQRTAFKSKITLVDMESRFDVNIVVDGRYEVYMGDISNTEEKLMAVEEILKTEELKSYAGAQIDASIPETISVKPIYIYE